MALDASGQPNDAIAVQTAHEDLPDLDLIYRLPVGPVTFHDPFTLVSRTYKVRHARFLLDPDSGGGEVAFVVTEESAGLEQRVRARVAMSHRSFLGLTEEEQAGYQERIIEQTIRQAVTKLLPGNPAITLAGS